MANENNVNTRIQHKHDTEANWLKSVYVDGIRGEDNLKTKPFIPKAGELIIYDPDDDNCSYIRFKIGDGVKNVDALDFVNKEIVDRLAAVEGAVEQLKSTDYFTYTTFEDEWGEIYCRCGVKPDIDLPEILIVPESIDGYPVMEIAERGFAQENVNTMVHTIILPYGLKKIGAYAFAAQGYIYEYGPSSLKEIVLPSTVCEVESNAFSMCVSLEKINFENTTITTTPPYVFDGCAYLE